MKKTFLRAIALTLSLLMVFSTFVGCAKTGEKGPAGPQGEAGLDGKSAYELAVANGYTGTVEEWLSSLIGNNGTDGVDGIDGKDGKDGADGKDGKDGANGKSAYEIAVANGYIGTVEEWLSSLKGSSGTDGADGDNGADGANGKSAYELAVEKGYTGTEEEWLASLVGAKGETGAQGIGIAGAHIDENMHLILELTDSSEIDAGYVGTVKKHTVTFDWNCDDSSLATTTVVVEEGAVLEMPTIPERANAIFLGWYTDEECTEAFDFTTSIRDNTTLYASWREETYADILEYQKAELQELKNLNDGELPEILLNEDTYAPAFILGTYSDETVTDFDSAIESLKDVENLLGFRNVEEEYAEMSLFAFEDTIQYRMQQMYNGYVVYGQQLIVTTDKNGKVTSLSGDYATIGTLFNPSVNITMAEAIALATEYNEFKSTEVTLVAYTLDGYNEMAYVLENDAYTVVVSADDGTIITAGTNVMTALLFAEDRDIITSTIGRNESGDTFNTAYIDYIDPTKQDNYIFYDKVRDIVYRDFEMIDSSSKELIGYEAPLVDEDNVWTSGVAEKTISLSKNLSDTYDFYLEVLGLMSYDGNGGQIWAYVNDGYEEGNNAYNSGPHDVNGEVVTVFSFGGVANYQNNLDVVTHEYTHAIQGALVDVGGYAQLEAGALKEAYSDVMGLLVELYVTGTTDWTICDRNIKKPADIWWTYADRRSLPSPTKVDGVGYYYRDPNATGEVLDSQNSNFGHHNSTVISHAIYKMYDRGINDVAELTELLYRTWSYLSFDASFYDYRMSMLAAAKDMNLNSEKISYIVDAFDEANIKYESYDDAWQLFAQVNLYCKVVDNRGDVVPNARILVEKVDEAGTDVAEVQCDENGEYRIDLSLAGTYKITVSAIGYETYSEPLIFEKGTSKEITFTLTKETSTNSVLKVGGQITDALTGEAVEGVVMKFRKGYEITSGRVKPSLTTGADGRYYTEDLECGYYTVELSKPGYITSYVILQAAADWEGADNENILSQNFSISPMVQADATLRIVLSWGANPYDLDSHVLGTSTDGDSYHVFWDDKEAYNSEGEKITELDIDDTTSYGPETITIDLKKQGESIHYCVHDYSNRNITSNKALAYSGAKIQVYSDNNLIVTYNVPTTQVGTVWHVFDYDVSTGQITDINEITNSISPVATYSRSPLGMVLPEKGE